MLSYLGFSWSLLTFNSLVIVKLLIDSSLKAEPDISGRFKSHYETEVWRSSFSACSLDRILCSGPQWKGSSSLPLFLQRVSESCDECNNQHGSNGWMTNGEGVQTPLIYLFSWKETPPDSSAGQWNSWSFYFSSYCQIWLPLKHFPSPRMKETSQGRSRACRPLAPGPAEHWRRKALNSLWNQFIEPLQMPSPRWDLHRTCSEDLNRPVSSPTSLSRGRTMTRTSLNYDWRDKIHTKYLLLSIINHPPPTPSKTSLNSPFPVMKLCRKVFQSPGSGWMWFMRSKWK